MSAAATRVAATDPSANDSSSKGPALGKDFGRLWGAAIGSNLSDGIARLAIPLAAVGLTTDPIAIAVLTALAYVPWLIFGVPSGMIVDRVDRRHAMAAASVVRVVAAAGVALAIATDQITLWVLAAAVLVFGLGETLFDNATNAVLPSLVRRRGLDKANGRIQAAQVGVDMFVAQPVSGVLFSLAIVLPMVVSGAGYLIAGALVLLLPATAARAGRSELPAADAGDGDRSGEAPAAVPLRAALGFLWRHRYLRSMVLVTSLVGGFLAFAQAITVLLFVDHYGVTAELVGIVTAGIGLGGVAGALTAGRVVVRLGRGRTMLGAAIAGGVGLVGVGLAPNAWVAVLAYSASAYGIAMWNVPWGSLRQSIIPGHMLGRVLGAARTVTWGLMPVATMLGGWVARVDLQLPYLIGGAGTVLVSLIAGRLLLSADAHMPADDKNDTDATQVVSDAEPVEEVRPAGAGVTVPQAPRRS
ncbi:MFS transporter [Demequina muriae]|uniref:MFS transporter n=1 Tax=Demequina muriae TaxID=3051664 RepID=A0ABT8GDV3_9MICO|nr:MFS transporter [Demequina sp. EGI L300058]MDN4479615.1 MFS transporter [Demequina sp. EGI L300058]